MASFGGIPWSLRVGDPCHVAEITMVPAPPGGCEEVPATLSRLIEAHETVLVACQDAVAPRARELSSRSRTA